MIARSSSPRPRSRTRPPVLTAPTGPASCRRRAVAWVSSPAVSWDAVADAGDGLDDRWLAEFAAQHHDGEPDDTGERVDVLVPGLLQQLFGGHHAAVGAQELGEHGELFAGQRNVLAVAGDGPEMRVELDIQ